MLTVGSRSVVLCWVSVWFPSAYDHAFSPRLPLFEFCVDWSLVAADPFQSEVRMGRHDGRLHEPAREIMRRMRLLVTGHLVLASSVLFCALRNLGSMVRELFRRPCFGRMMPASLTFCKDDLSALFCRVRDRSLTGLGIAL